MKQRGPRFAITAIPLIFRRMSATKYTTPSDTASIMTISGQMRLSGRYTLSFRRGWWPAMGPSMQATKVYGGAEKFKTWLKWFDSELRKDPM